MRNKLTIILIFIFTTALLAQKIAKVNSTTSIDWRKSQKININNISTWIHWDGRSDINLYGVDTSEFNANQENFPVPGFEFPKGSGKFLSKYSGLLWGGVIGEKGVELPRIGGTMDSTSLTPGWITSEGKPVNTNDPRVRIYKTRKNFVNADLSGESDDEGRTIEVIRNQYKKDAEEWPVDLGAPYDDVNGDRIYTNGVDIPGIPGADQTLWFVCNDFGIENGIEKINPFGSQPTKLEIQFTVWAYDNESPYSNTIFKKYKLINKSDTSIVDMHISIYCDQEVGDNFDDFSGYDSVLSLGYAYNSKNGDNIYGALSPAMGILLLQGPIATENASPNDVAIFDGKKHFNKKNLIAETFSFYIDNDPIYFKPRYFDLTDFCIVMYNYWQNKYMYCSWGGCTELYPMPLSGNPISGYGWVDGIIHKPGNRSFNMSSGPFNMAPGDTQEVVIAQFATISNNWAHSLVSVKDMARKLHFDYKNFLYSYPSLPEKSKGVEPIQSLPEYYYLSQNYPNPFNPSTEIKYEIPIDCNVTLKVFDLLGREVATLVDEYKQAGSYSSTFSIRQTDGGQVLNSQLSSGVYIYSLQAGPYYKYKKMMLIK